MGDVHFNFKHQGVVYDTSFCRLSFNTAFISPSNTLLVKKNSISPDSVSKDARFSDDFMIQFVFEDYCRKCNKSWELNLDDICPNCKALLKEDLTYWRSMQIILDNYDHPTLEDGLRMHYNVEKARESHLEKELLYDSSQYKINKFSKETVKK